MLAVRKTDAIFGVSVSETPDLAAPGRGQIRIGVQAAGICGSDVHVYEWTAGYEGLLRRMPFTLGHEFAGAVEAVGEEVGWLRIGQRVTVMPAVHCGYCDMCRKGEEDHCGNRVSIGLGLNGGFAPAVMAPAANCIPVPDTVDAELAALVEPLCVGLQAVEIGAVAVGQTVAVLGVGMIGLAMAMMARLAGARVILVGKSDGQRFALARRLGFAECIDLDRTSLAQGLAALVDGKVDCVLEATGAPSSVTDGLSILRKRGIYVAGGIYATPMSLNLTDFVRNKHQIRGTHSSTRANWYAMLDILSRKPEEFRPLITHRLPLGDAIEGFELCRARKAMKVMLHPQQA